MGTDDNAGTYAPTVLIGSARSAYQGAVRPASSSRERPIKGDGRPLAL